MAILDIVFYPDPRLKEECETVSEITDDIRKLLDNMAETMYDAPGIGLAGPQVGSNLRVCIVDVGGSDAEEGDEEEEVKPKDGSTLYKLINPRIVSKSGEIDSEEGCLSIPTIREKVTRAESVVVQALNERGEELEIQADGILSICLQHEIDHLDGVLFIDYLSRLKLQLVKSKLKKLIL